MCFVSCLHRPCLPIRNHSAFRNEFRRICLSSSSARRSKGNPCTPLWVGVGDSTQNQVPYAFFHMLSDAVPEMELPWKNYDSSTETFHSYIWAINMVPDTASGAVMPPEIDLEHDGNSYWPSGYRVRLSAPGQRMHYGFGKYDRPGGPVLLQAIQDTQPQAQTVILGSHAPSPNPESLQLMQSQNSEFWQAAWDAAQAGGNFAHLDSLSVLGTWEDMLNVGPTLFDTHLTPALWNLLTLELWEQMGMVHEYGDTTDTDGDGVLDYRDNCRLTPNQDQLDSDSAGYRNACDFDLDTDGTVSSWTASTIRCFARVLGGGRP